MAHFVYDIETLSLESTAVVLSAAIVYFDDLEIEPTQSMEQIFWSLVDKSLYVKFSAREQIDAKRHVSKSTLDWWKKQDLVARELAFNPSDADVSVNVGMGMIRDYINKHEPDPFNVRLWTRGSLDQLCTDSLCAAFDLSPITHYGNYRDVRTALDILATTFHKGYCKLSKPFETGIVKKHDPRHDCCYDALMLTYPQ